MYDRSDADAAADFDRVCMHRALAEAAHGLGYVEPNPMVGSVVARDGQIISVGHHERFGGAHAEVHALNRAGDGARGATLYVSLEPCCHVGKTPPCTWAIRAAGIRRVVVAMRDPFPAVSGGGVAELSSSGVVVEVGLMADAAAALNAAYLKRLKTGRPFVTAKWAMTLDGKIATRTGDSRWISGERSRARVHALRGRMDAIVIGIGTALADDPLLTARPAGARTATRIVLDSRGRLPLESRLVRTASDAPVLLAYSVEGPTVDALRDMGCETRQFGTGRGVSVANLLDHLGERGMTNVLVEGGAGVLSSFFDAGAVDAVEIFIAPKISGGAGAPSPLAGIGVERIADALGLHAVEVARLNNDLHIKALTSVGARQVADSSAISNASCSDSTE